MFTDKSERSLSPLGKDPLSIGKLFKPNRIQQLNPQATNNTQMLKNQSQYKNRSPKSIGINTSRTFLPAVPITTSYNNYENQMKPITHTKMKQQLDYVNKKNHQSQINRSFDGVNQQYIQKQKKNQQRNQIPNVVDFPSSYGLDDQFQKLPETPDLPNRLSSRLLNQNKKQSPVILMKKMIQQQPQPGVIKHQVANRIFSNSAPKDFGSKAIQTQSSLFSSPQLPHINKIQNNIKGVKKILNNATNNHVASSSQIYTNNSVHLNENNKRNNLNFSSNFNSPYMPKKSLTKNIGEILKKYNDKCDPQQDEKLHKRKNFRISNINLQTSRMKLPTFRQENGQQFQQQVDFDNLNKRKSFNQRSTNAELYNKMKVNDKLQMLNNSMGSPQTQQPHEFPPGTLFSNSFIRNTPQIHPDNVLKIDLRTSLQKIKQSLIQGGEQMSASFTIPQMFYHPPTTSSTSQQLHMLMLQILSHVGINPQIVTIKKYINCVMMRQKKLCILWNFNGKIYFGGWKKDQTMTQGNKDGVGVQWVPSRYIYYGEFKDNKKEGYGIMKKSNKQMYIGCWKNNQRWGWGKVYDPQGNLHQNGQFIEGCFILPKKNYNSNQKQPQQ